MHNCECMWEKCECVSVCLCVGVLKRLEEEDLDECVRRRLKDSSETPGALWHIYLNRDMVKVQEFLHKVSCCCFKWKSTEQVQVLFSLTSFSPLPPPTTSALQRAGTVTGPGPNQRAWLVPKQEAASAAAGWVWSPRLDCSSVPRRLCSYTSRLHVPGMYVNTQTHWHDPRSVPKSWWASCPGNRFSLCLFSTFSEHNAEIIQMIHCQISFECGRISIFHINLPGTW